MPSFGDTAIIALIALLLFGPKKLPELARQLGKLMAEFRRASNEFKMQMEDELRTAEQEEQQKKIAAMQAAAPVAPPLISAESTASDTSQLTDSSQTASEEVPLGEVAPVDEYSISGSENPSSYSSYADTTASTSPAAAEVLPIASSGELDMMPPSTGLPVERSSSSATLTPVLEAIPHTDEAESATQPPADQNTHEASVHG
jgi:sec-independent protein translocase protein TatB